MDALPRYLLDSGYQNPTDAPNTPFQVAHRTESTAFEWAVRQPKLMQDFNLWMRAQRTGQETWLDVFPSGRFAQDEESEAPLFVDIGGGVGHQCAALKARFPSITRRVILQDLPKAIEHAIPTDGVEPMIHNFWSERPVKGILASNPCWKMADHSRTRSLVYYMRNVLHDYPDKKCVALLHNTMAAMSKVSKILIDEMILPNVGTHWQAAQLNVGMMSSLAAMERSKSQWYTLMESAKSTIEEVYPYTAELHDSVMVVALRQEFVQ